MSWIFSALLYEGKCCSKSLTHNSARATRLVMRLIEEISGPKDALTLPRGFYRDGEIATRRSKTGSPVFWPCPKPLEAVLKAAPPHDAITLCANSDGYPWTVSGFRASWRKVRIKLEAIDLVSPALTLYGLRHTVAVILREIGCDERTIADALGQKTIEMARH